MKTENINRVGRGHPTATPHPKKKRPSLAEVGWALVEEANRVMAAAGPNEAERQARLLSYISKLGEKHPEWQSAMNKARRRAIRIGRRGSTPRP